MVEIKDVLDTWAEYYAVKFAENGNQQYMPQAAEEKEEIAELIGSEHIKTYRNINTNKHIEQVRQDYAVKCESMEKDKTMLLNKIDELEQYSRRNSIRVFGIPENNDENVRNKIIELCSHKLNVNIDNTQIDRAHRVGSTNTANSKHTSSHRGIMVKFINYEHKMLVLQNRKKLKGSKVVITEDLTSTRYKLLRNAREKFGFNNAREKFGFNSAFTINGTITVKTKSNSYKIKTAEDLIRIV
ncbi:hypothetical protein QE152_g14036 [Popillia japonica]|uniref:Uncharacterized protein n=1 Tax=Popillia japonica TaxID=7064 RepID=A0AAW1LC15_POPJA